jgi:hypothetical protein
MSKIVRCPECGEWNDVPQGWLSNGYVIVDRDGRGTLPAFAFDSPRHPLPIKGIRCTCAYTFTGRERAIRSGPFADNNIQFPRILAELYALGIPKELMNALQQTTDLTKGQICEILERADNEWQRIKHATPGG